MQAMIDTIAIVAPAAVLIAGAIAGVCGYRIGLRRGRLAERVAQYRADTNHASQLRDADERAQVERAWAKIAEALDPPA